jgi:hypothetical protein
MEPYPSEKSSIGTPAGRKKFFRAGGGTARGRIKISCPDNYRDWLLFVVRQKVTLERNVKKIPKERII